MANSATFTAPVPTPVQTFETGTYRFRCLGGSMPYMADNFEKTTLVWKSDFTFVVDGDAAGEPTEFDGKEIVIRFVKIGFLINDDPDSDGYDDPAVNLNLLSDERGTFTKIVNGLVGMDWYENSRDWAAFINKRCLGEVTLKANGYPTISGYLSYGRRKPAAQPPAKIVPKQKAPVQITAPFADDVPPPEDPDDDF